MFSESHTPIFAIDARASRPGPPLDLSPRYVRATDEPLFCEKALVAFRNLGQVLTSLFEVPPKSTIALMYSIRILYCKFVNLDILLSRFVVVECVTSSLRFVLRGTEGVNYNAKKIPNIFLAIDTCKGEKKIKLCSEFDLDHLELGVELS